MLSLFRRLFGDTRSERHYIAVDLGSNTAVRSMLFSETAHDRVSIQKQHFELPSRKEGSDYAPLIDEYLRRILSQYVKSVRAVPAQIVIGLGSSFAENEVRTIRHERSKPHTGVEPGELKAVLDTFMKTQAECVINGKPFTLAHLMPFHVTLDGYPIHDVTTSTSGKLLEIQIFATYAPSPLWIRLAGLRSLLGGIPIRFVSDQAAIAAAVITLMNIQDAALIKVGARATEVTILLDGGIAMTGSFGRGGDSLTQAIAVRLGIPLLDAERMKRQLGTIELPPATLTAVTEVMRGEVEAWLHDLVQFFRNHQHTILPDRIFLFGGGSSFAPLREALTTKPWYHDLTFHERITVSILNAEDIPGLKFRNAVSPVRGAEEVALAALIYRANH